MGNRQAESGDEGGGGESIEDACHGASPAQNTVGCFNSPHGGRRRQRPAHVQFGGNRGVAPNVPVLPSVRGRTAGFGPELGSPKRKPALDLRGAVEPALRKARQGVAHAQYCINVRRKPRPHRIERFGPKVGQTAAALFA